MPERIQRQRTKGWRMPEGAVYVGRPTLWGNPWTMADARDWHIPPKDRRAWLVKKYREEMTTLGLLSDFSCFASAGSARDRAYVALRDMDLPDMAAYARALLRGKDLACCCPLVDGHGDRYPCHADVLLDLANREA